MEENNIEEQPKKMRVALVYPMNKDKNYAVNKDLNGGFGTADDYGDSIPSKIIKAVKRRTIRLPVVGMAFLQAILKQQGHEVRYFEESLPEEPYDLLLVYGSVIDYKNENKVCRELKEKFSEAKVGIFGPFPQEIPRSLTGGSLSFLGKSKPFL